MDLSNEKLKAFEHIKSTVSDVMDDDTFLTHDMLIILIRETKKLIASDF
jgi:hypothetical protein